MFINKLVVLLIILGMSSCYYDIEDELYVINECELPMEVSYATDVNPILQQNCTTSQCHASTNPDRASLETYDDLIIVIDNGTFQSYTFDNRSMPPSGPLDACTIELLKKWIADGNQNN